MEGVLVRKNLDVFATVGKNAAYVYTVPNSFAVNDGALSIGFTPSRQNPILSGIEILPAPPPPPLYRISCGSSTEVTDSNNVVWSADQFFVRSGKPYNTCGTVTNDVYCTSRYFRTVNGSPFRYEIPVPETNTVYMIRMHFSEQVCVYVVSSYILIFGVELTDSLLKFHKKAGLREFDVSVEGLLVIDNLDIFRDAPGQNVPYIVTMNTVVNDGFITIDFVAGINDPQINAIEVFRVGLSKLPTSPTVPPLPTPNSRAPAAAPFSVPVARPVRPPTTKFPTAAPLALPPNSQPVPVPPAGSFRDIFINCGGKIRKLYSA